jgi:hypothetical protein
MNIEVTICMNLINLIFQKADMAVIDLSITSQRQKAVDFTMPYMNTGAYYRLTYYSKFAIYKNLDQILNKIMHIEEKFLEYPRAVHNL